MKLTKKEKKARDRLRLKEQQQRRKTRWEETCRQVELEHIARQATFHWQANQEKLQGGFSIL